MGRKPGRIRLTLRVGSEELRFALGSGRHGVGSASDNRIVLEERTVSRHHACIEVGNYGAASLTDLGSSNGTRVNDQTIASATPIRPGDRVAFGFVQGRIEAIEAGDERLAVDLGGVAAASKRGADGSTTLLPQSVARFACTHVPELLRRARSGNSVTQLAAALGRALLDGQEHAGVRILREGDRGDAILFAGGSEGEGTVRGSRNGMRVEIALGRGAEASAQPLLDLALELLALAEDHSEPAAKAAETPMPTLAARPQPESLDPQMRRVYDDAERVAGSDLAVLIQGESGTGKELLTQFLHNCSVHAQQPLVALNCAALPRDLLELELFGIEDGVATGVKARPGKFEQAHGGTLFLDEIGDLSAEAQAKLLRVLQEKVVLRIGGREPRAARVRVVCATHYDLQSRVEEGLFRLDLYHRIAAWKVTLPPLRDRLADVASLAAYFLSRAGARRGIRPKGISERALAVMQAYPWPGNVRQLEVEMERAALFLANGDVLDSTLLHEDIRRAASDAPVYTEGLEAILSRVERDAIRGALERTGGSVDAAAQLLKLSRSTLYRRIQALGMGERAGVGGDPRSGP